MLKLIDYNGNKFNLPETWKELPLGIYEDVLNLKYDKEIPTEYRENLIQTVTGIDIEIVKKIDEEQFNYLDTKLSWIVIEQPEKTKINKVFNVNGKQYYFNTNLNGFTKTKAFVDMVKILTNNESFWHCAGGVLATIIHPVKKIKYNYAKWGKWKGFDKDNYISLVELEPYDSNNIDAIAEDLKQLNCAEIAGVAFFLFSFLKELLTGDTNTSLNQNPKIKMELENLLNKIWKQPSLNDTVGNTQ